MVIPNSITPTTEYQGKKVTTMAVLAGKNDYTGHNSSTSHPSDSDTELHSVLDDVLDMQSEAEKKTYGDSTTCSDDNSLKQADLLGDLSSFQSIKTKCLRSQYQTNVDHESDVSTSELQNTEWRAVQIRDVKDFPAPPNIGSAYVHMVQARDEEFRQKLLQNAIRNQNQPQDSPHTSVADPLKEPALDDANVKAVTVYEKKYLGKPREREIEVLRAMKHRSIPAFYDAEIHGNCTILRMEYCGEPLARYVEKHYTRGSFVPENYIWNISEQMMDLLRYLEHAKIVHQNISAETICIQPHTRKGLLVKLVGFGKVLTHQDLVPATELQCKPALGGTVQFCEASVLTYDLGPRMESQLPVNRSLLGPCNVSEASSTEDMVPRASVQMETGSCGRDQVSRLSCQTDMVACGWVALFMANGPSILKTLTDNVTNLSAGLELYFPKRYSRDLKDFVLKMIDANPLTGLKPATGLDKIHDKLSREVIELSDSDEAIELSDSDEEVVQPSADWVAQDAAACPPIPVSPQLQTPLQQGVFTFFKNGNGNKDLPLITPIYSDTRCASVLSPSSYGVQDTIPSHSLPATSGAVGYSFDRPDNVIALNPGTSLYREPEKAEIITLKGKTQATTETLHKLKSRVTGNKGTRDKPYIRPQNQEFTNLPNFKKIR